PLGSYPLDSAGGTDLFLSKLLSTVAPTAIITGPSVLPEGTNLVLDASHSSSPQGQNATDHLSYDWDINGDGQFGDVLNPTNHVSLDWTQLHNLGISPFGGVYRARVKVTDSFSDPQNPVTTTSAPITFTTADPIPVLNLIGDDTAVAGSAYTLSFG